MLQLLPHEYMSFPQVWFMPHIVGAMVANFGGATLFNAFSWSCHAIGVARLDEWLSYVLTVDSQYKRWDPNVEHI